MVELVNLRFIALTYMGNCKLPASIAKLRNLQTLLFYQGKFKVNINTLYLPAEIWKMPQLRHILFEKCFLPYPSGARNWKKFCWLGKPYNTLQSDKFQMYQGSPSDDAKPEEIGCFILSWFVD
ncbi:putative late blight resistance protein-like protein R1A-10 [Forsythia ovata]|uniref:Late blight resistance protein-like protein R1A-10 n=1 Tax=Forsythia ovata TaxID=205694 RepID=A0ABD1TRQ2_9LAMI